MNDFEKFTSAQNDMSAHQQEIKNTRVGGLGGSDAAMVLRVAKNGLAALNNTDMKRLSVMMGLTEQQDFGGNVYTEAGHKFEDYCEGCMCEAAKETIGVDALVSFDGNEIIREALLEKQIAKNFKTFAHADFYAQASGVVVECKFVQDTTEAVAKKYAAQLQWYYMLGAEKVFLTHGWGTVEPFDVEDFQTPEIERDDVMVELLITGIAILDEAISNGWLPNVADKMHVNTAPNAIAKAFDRLAAIKKQQADLKAEEDAIKEQIIGYMEDFGCSTLYDGEHTASYVREATSRTFDSVKFLKAHPEYDCDENYKTSKRKASVTYK